MPFENSTPVVVLMLSFPGFSESGCCSGNFVTAINFPIFFSCEKMRETVRGKPLPKDCRFFFLIFFFLGGGGVVYCSLSGSAVEVAEKVGYVKMDLFLGGWIHFPAWKKMKGEGIIIAEKSVSNFSWEATAAAATAAAAAAATTAAVAATATNVSCEYETWFA